jgi:hypothetical protein
MPTITVRFNTTATEPPTLGYRVSYRRVGVDASPTFLSVNPAPYPDLSNPSQPFVTIPVDNLLGGYQYEITVQPQCSPTLLGSLLTFTKVLSLKLVTGRDPSSSAAACAATKNITLYSPTVNLVAGIQLYTTQDVDTLGSSLTLNVLGWYSDGTKAYNVNSSGIITSVVNC